MLSITTITLQLRQSGLDESTILFHQITAHLTGRFIVPLVLRSRQVRLFSRWIGAAGKSGALAPVLTLARNIPGCEALLVGYQRCFPSLAEAKRYLGTHDMGGHNNQRNITIHKDLADEPRPSDFTVFEHLRARAKDLHSIFDLGGNIGNLYYYYPRFLALPQGFRWVVQDLSDVVAAGREIAARRPSPGLEFTAEVSAADGCDLLLASGSMHYFDEPLPDLVGRLTRKPKLVLINRSPMTDGTPFATVQDAGAYRVACMIHNRSDVIRGFEATGYRLAAQWMVTDMSLGVPFHPERSVPHYSGLLFERM